MDLRSFSAWTRENKITTNAKKTKFMVFSREPTSMNINLDGVLIEQVRVFRYLGVMLDNRLQFEDHIDDLVHRLSSLTGALRRA
uniref:Reverse transcriptase domain-containing protein n=1 Tax=Lutzomyia longipalpis TaxID=7200 RepID=A0A1B0CCJ0_LUTLO